MAYSDLSLPERAQVIRMGVQAGLNSLKNIRTFYDSMQDSTEFKDGGSIHINLENRGKFNATKARTGKTTEELTHSKNPLTRKRAIFAQNARKWKHADGGDTQKPRRVDFEAYMTDTTDGGNRNRPMNIEAMEQFQDSLIAREFAEPQRLALLATAAQEMDERGAASIGVGGNGYLGLSTKRMPIDLLDDSPEGRGKQIHHILEDLTHVYTGYHPQAGNWNDGGEGGPKIKTGQDGSNKFWSAVDAATATRILNKSYIRPAGRQAAWDNRASVAEGMQKHMHSTGGIQYPFSFRKKTPTVIY